MDVDTYMEFRKLEEEINQLKEQNEEIIGALSEILGRLDYKEQAEKTTHRDEAEEHLIKIGAIKKPQVKTGVKENKIEFDKEE